MGTRNQLRGKFVIDRMRRVSIRSLILLAVVTTACVAAPEVSTPTGKPSTTSATARLAVATPLLAPDGQTRFISSGPEVRAEDPVTGSVRWRLGAPLLPGGSAMDSRVLVSADSASVYVQLVRADGQSPTYLGTRRVDARTGAVLADDIKFEDYWYENLVLWTALTQDGRLQMAIKRASAAGGGYWLRMFDPLTLKMLTDVRQSTTPAAPRT